MFSKFSIRLFFSSLILMLAITLSSQAQIREGACGFTANMAMPSGITASAGLPSSVISSFNLSYSASTSFLIALSNAFQLDLGLGFVNISYSVPSGQTAPASQSIIAIMAGGKYFLRAGDVSPYIGAGLSYSSLPKVTVGTTETTGSLFTFTGFFGAQAYINSGKTVALFIQMGIGFNSGSITTKVGSNSATNGISTMNLGGSAFGGSVYF